MERSEVRDYADLSKGGSAPCDIVARLQVNAPGCGTRQRPTWHSARLVPGLYRPAGSRIHEPTLTKRLSRRRYGCGCGQIMLLAVALFIHSSPPFYNWVLRSPEPKQNTNITSIVAPEAVATASTASAVARTRAVGSAVG